MATTTSKKSSTIRSTNRSTAKSTTRSTTRATTKEAKPRSSSKVLGLPLKTWAASFRRARKSDIRSGKRAFVFAFNGRDPKILKKTLASHLNKWQMLNLLESEAETVSFQGSNGPLWVVRSLKPVPAVGSNLEKTDYARFRDLTGATLAQILTYRPDKLVLEFHGLSAELESACVLGFEIAAYSFQENREPVAKARKDLPEVLLNLASPELTEEKILAAGELGLGVNIARHFTNLPGGTLNPATYAEAAVEMFEGSSSAEVTVWAGEKLRQEKMGLLMAVGAAAEGPRLVHIRYRPKGATSQPIAIVGKGITFDSGGLDIKPSSGMRLMKKDMGGSAAALAIVKWAERTELPIPLDVYLSLAENAISGGAFRPGDIITARNGANVEISNTDAEGRLVLADALDVAATQTGEDKPSAIINLATLTGAIKVGLGAEIAGLFSNNDELADALARAGNSRGDLMWRMPLFQPYRSMFKSPFADFMNSSEGGFGGAITAALFLESFVRGIPWAHLDVYAWKDSASGAWAEPGGNGQPVQAIAETLLRITTRDQEMA